MDEDACMVDVARFFMEFCQDRVLRQVRPLPGGDQADVGISSPPSARGGGAAADIELLEEMAAVINDAALCGSAATVPTRSSPPFVTSAMNTRPISATERCPASVCSALFTSPCQNTCPIGMDVPAYLALIKANRLADAYQVLLKTNPFPGICGRVCDHQCQTTCRRGQVGGEPIAIKFLKGTSPTTPLDQRSNQ